ncbi:MAG: hypothetical protein VW714_12980 [Rhodospirillales bacterium]
MTCQQGGAAWSNEQGAMMQLSYPARLSIEMESLPESFQVGSFEEPVVEAQKGQMEFVNGCSIH